MDITTVGNSTAYMIRNTVTGEESIKVHPSDAPAIVIKKQFPTLTIPECFFIHDDTYILALCKNLQVQNFKTYLIRIDLKSEAKTKPEEVVCLVKEGDIVVLKAPEQFIVYRNYRTQELKF